MLSDSVPNKQFILDFFPSFEFYFIFVLGAGDFLKLVGKQSA
jgi:hypothetical protein